MIHEICMVKPATGRKIDCYFTTGHVRRFDMAPLLKPDCGPVFRPLRNRKTFLDTMTVINGTLAFDVAGGRNEYKCVDIDPETIFEQGEPVTSIIRPYREKPTGGTKAARDGASRRARPAKRELTRV